MLARKLLFSAALAAILGAALFAAVAPSRAVAEIPAVAVVQAPRGRPATLAPLGRSPARRDAPTSRRTPRTAAPAATVCGTGQTCQSGICACGTGLLSCGGSCVSSSNANCGSCGTTCSSTQVCSNNACSSSCASWDDRLLERYLREPADRQRKLRDLRHGLLGRLDLQRGLLHLRGDRARSSAARACIDTTSNNSNCGSCGHACTTGQTCTNSVCTTVSTTGTAGSTGSGTGGDRQRHRLARHGHGRHDRQPPGRPAAAGADRHRHRAAAAPGPAHRPVPT